MSTAPLKKEPEDIFSGLDTGGDAPVGTAPMDMEMEPHRSPLKVILLAIIIVLLVAAVGTAVWYFVIREKPVETGIITPTSTNSPVVTATSEPIVETPPALPPDSDSVPPNIPPPQSITTSTPTTPEPVAPTTPTVTRTEAADTDADGISDPEEAILSTDATIADSDADGFSDASELENGYDPAATQLAISASPRFHDVAIGSTLGVYLPAAWTASVDSASLGGYTIQTGTPTSFGVRIMPRVQGQSFAAWLSSNDPGVDPSTIRNLTTRTGFAAHMTFDRMRTYIEVPGSMVTIIYEPGTSTTYDFRAIYDYIVQTLRVR